MTLEELKKALAAIAPTAYRVFKKKVNPPFIVYALEGEDDLKADNVHYFEIADGFVELYTTKKEPAREKAVTNALDALEIPWEKENEDYIPGQRMMYVRWSIQLIGG